MNYGETYATAARATSAGSGLSFGEGLFIFTAFTAGFIAIMATSTAPRMFL